jgi:gliding motility-associated-like protein
VDDTWQPAPCAILPFGQQAYLDDVSSLFQTTGRFCYRIEAYEGGGNIYGFTDTSSSNEICLIQEPKVYVPTGFTPGGKNSVFKPSFIYVDAKNYFFIVFNRWGQKVFETNNPEEGWDGTFDGTLAPEGTYVYNVRIFGTNGQEIEKNGSVTLLR